MAVASSVSRGSISRLTLGASGRASSAAIAPSDPFAASSLPSLSSTKSPAGLRWVCSCSGTSSEIRSGLWTLPAVATTKVVRRLEAGPWSLDALTRSTSGRTILGVRIRSQVGSGSECTGSPSVAPGATTALPSPGRHDWIGARPPGWLSGSLASCSSSERVPMGSPMLAWIRRLRSSAEPALRTAKR
jgi:hypothetical protein